MLSVALRLSIALTVSGLIPGVLPGVSYARGLHLEPAPWYDVTLADTTLSGALEVSHFDGQRSGTVFGVAVTPLRRGRIEFSGRMSHVVVRERSDGEHEFGFGDPHLYARARVFGPPDSLAPSWSIYAEAAARLPIAKAELFPFASGGQEIELMGVVAMHRFLALHVGAGRIWAEPPSDSPLSSLDVPRATHVWLRFAHDRHPFVLWMRADGLIFEVKGTRRGVITSGITHRNRVGFNLTLEHAFESSARGERVFDQMLRLRFATPVR